MIRQLSLLTQMRMYFISKDRKGVSQSLLSMSFLNTENYILKIIIGIVDPNYIWRGVLFNIHVFGGNDVPTSSTWQNIKRIIYVD